MLGGSVWAVDNFTKCELQLNGKKLEVKKFGDVEYAKLKCSNSNEYGDNGINEGKPERDKKFFYVNIENVSRKNEKKYGFIDNWKYVVDHNAPLIPSENLDYGWKNKEEYEGRSIRYSGNAVVFDPPLHEDIARRKELERNEEDCRRKFTKSNFGDFSEVTKKFGLYRAFEIIYANKNCSEISEIYLKKPGGGELEDNGCKIRINDSYFKKDGKSGSSSTTKIFVKTKTGDEKFLGLVPYFDTKDKRSTEASWLSSGHESTHLIGMLEDAGLCKRKIHCVVPDSSNKCSVIKENFDPKNKSGQRFRELPDHVAFKANQVKDKVCFRDKSEADRFCESKKALAGCKWMGKFIQSEIKNFEEKWTCGAHSEVGDKKGFCLGAAKCGEGDIKFLKCRSNLGSCTNDAVFDSTSCIEL